MCPQVAGAVVLYSLAELWGHSQNKQECDTQAQQMGARNWDMPKGCTFPVQGVCVSESKAEEPSFSAGYAV